MVASQIVSDLTRLRDQKVILQDLVDLTRLSEQKLHYKTKTHRRYREP